MKILNAAIVVGSIIAIGSLAIATSRSALAFGAEAPIRLAATNDTATDKGSYTQRAQDEMQEWRRKLHDFSTTVKTKGQATGDAVEDDLSKAWNKAEAASRDLQTAGADSWDSAKAAFEKASHELAEAWDKARPQGK